MTCGSKKHIAEALAKIRVHDLEEPQDQLKSKFESKIKRSKMLQVDGQ